LFYADFNSKMAACLAASFGGISYPPTKTEKVSQQHASLGGYGPV